VGGLDVHALQPAAGRTARQAGVAPQDLQAARCAGETGRDYDRIYIDTPPALNFYTRSALIAAQGCLIPFDCDDFSRRALYTLLENVQEIQSDHNADLKVEGIVVNQFQPRANLPQRWCRS
jgi:cellulose biosynthesis protein BcsQ